MLKKVINIQPIQLQQNLKRLNIFRLLKHNWNGYDSDPIKIKAINIVKDILPKLEYQPEIFPLVNGEIQIEYETKDEDYLEFVTNTDKNILEIFYMKGKGKTELEANIEISADNINKIVKTFMEE